MALAAASQVLHTHLMQLNGQPLPQRQLRFRSIPNCLEFPFLKTATNIRSRARNNKMKTIYTTRSKKNFITRVISWAMASIIAVVTSPAPMAFAQSAAPASEPIPTPPASIMPKADTKPVHVKTGPHKLEKIINKLSFSAQPTDLEISCARVFSEPLVPMSGQPVSAENAALAPVLKSCKKKNSFEDLSDLTKFISAFPNS